MSTRGLSSKIGAWLDEPLDDSVRLSLERIARLDDVERIAVMPDVHLSKEVCVGAVIATHSGVYPQAVGGDIGCGMTAVQMHESELTFGAREARRLLTGIRLLVPPLRHGATTAMSRLPDELMDWSLSTAALEKHKQRDGRVQFGTLGRGNHFLEIQRDESGLYWVMVHTGSRSMGQYITRHHLEQATDDTPLGRLDAAVPEGRAYLNDLDWARRYAVLSRRSVLGATEIVIEQIFGRGLDWHTLIDREHNHVRAERYDEMPVWVHRKGAAPAGDGLPGIIPGSMGAASFHTRGRGCTNALCSNSHGAGRAMSRTDARRAVSLTSLSRQMRGVWFDEAMADRLRDEAPSAYKDIGKVMRAQRQLTAIVRKLEPVLSYKGA